MHRSTACNFFMVAMVALSLGYAPAAQADGADTIAEVQVKGLRRVDREAALAGTKSVKGSAFDPSVVTQDLHIVWRTGFFRDVRVDKEVDAQGTHLLFTVVEKPSIRAIKFTGRDAISEDDVKAVVDVKPYTILNIDLLKRNVEKIKDLYVSKGYYLAEVRYRIEPIKDAEEVNVIFDLVENAKVMVRQITFIGNKHLPSAEIKSVLQTREGNEISWISQTGTYKEEFFQTDLMRIQALYYDHGFVTVKVGEPTATISKDRRYIYLSVPIEEGEQYSVGNIHFAGEVELKDEKGEGLVNEEELRKKLTIIQGTTFSRTKLFADIQSLTDVYRDYGYAYANVTPNSQVHPDTKVVDLDLEVERGEMVYFERIEISGNTRTRDKVIRRELRIYEGEKYSAGNVNLSRARVYQLGYFETVNITTARGSRPDLMVATVEIKEKSTGTFQIGAGFSSYESFIATAQISQNNFLGNGQLLSISMQLSFGAYARQLATLQFYEPYFMDSPWSMGINAYLTQRFYRDFQRNSRGVSPSFGYPITHDLRISAGYTVENVQITTGSAMPQAIPVLYNLNRDGISSAFNASLAYDTRDNRLFPTLGMYHDLRMEWSSTAFGADSSLAFKRLEADFRIYRPLPLSFVFKANATFGWVFGADGGVPISERYFPGGIYSVRGFQPRGLGPIMRVESDVSSPYVESRDFVFGGNKQVVLNFELEFPIIEQAGIKGVIFADAGNAYNDNEGFFYIGTPTSQRTPGYMMGSNRQVNVPLGLFYSFGFGFRWFSPIGPLRFEWGIPITKHEPDGDGMIFEFTIGNFF